MVRYGAIIVAGATGLLVVGACSSVPEVTFEDDTDAAAPSGLDGGARSDAAANDSASLVEAGSFACPDKAPPDSVGRCCGDRLCFACSLADCVRCLAAPCDEKKGLFCCGKNGNSLKCSAPEDC